MRGREEYCYSMDELYCTWRSLFIGGRTPLGPAAPGVRRLGEAAARGAAPPPTLMGCDIPLGLVVAAGRGRQLKHLGPYLCFGN
jgi:hypothetical protein